MAKTTRTRKTSNKLDKIIKKAVWCDYHVDNLVPPIIVRRFDDRRNNRFYYFSIEGEVKIAIGTTSAFGMVSTEREAIERWKEKFSNWKQLLNASADYGSLLHILFGKLMLKQGVDKPILASMEKIALDNGRSGDMPKKDVLALMRFNEDYKLTPLLIEAQLIYCCPKTGEYLALTIDALVKIEDVLVEKREVQDGVYSRGDRKGEPKMITEKVETPRTRIMLGDLKSNFFEKDEKSFFEAHRMQLITGAKAVEQNFGIKVDGVFNLSPTAWRTTPNYTYYEHDISGDLATWDAYWNLIVAKKLNTPKGNILVCKDFKDSNDFSLLGYKEYAEQILNPTI